MNWDAVGKLTGWLPGAGAGSILGAVFALLTFDSLKESCPVGEPFVGIGGVVSQLRMDCVQTPVGDLGSGEFFAACVAVAGILGAIGNLIVVNVGDEAT